MEIFTDNILRRFRDGPVGDICRQNLLIQLVGYKHYVAGRCEISKINETRKEVMSEMRELTRLFIEWKTLVPATCSFEDMFNRKHLETLKQAMNNMCQTTTENSEGEIIEGKEKHGLKLLINAIIKKTIKCLKGHFNNRIEDEKAKELENFVNAYNFANPELLSNARYLSVKSSLDKARRPENLPQESSLYILKNFIQQEIARRNPAIRMVKIPCGQPTYPLQWKARG
jgi:hypothetical protein